MGQAPVTRIPLYQVDAFARELFQGNPAAVLPLEEWLPDNTLQAIAQENNLSETAFLLPGEDPVPLRWFTPTEEVPLCGHATLAAGYVVLTHLEPERDRVSFRTKSGLLTVTRDGDGFAMDFPTLETEEVAEVPAALVEGLGKVEIREVRINHDDPNYFAILEDREAVASLRPDLRLLEELHPYGVAVSAQGDSNGPGHFVSRYFAPGYGIPEDPVTGSIHCALGPYWAGVLGRSELEAVQLSRRRGHLGVWVLDGGRVVLKGQAVLYLRGELHLGGGS